MGCGSSTPATPPSQSSPSPAKLAEQPIANEQSRDAAVKEVEVTPTPQPEPTPAPPKSAEPAVPTPKPEPTPASKPEPERAPEPVAAASAKPAAMPAVAAEPAPKPPPSAEKHIVLILGAPGSGVSEQCAMLAKVFGCAHLAVGRIMRDEVMRQSAESSRIGHLVAEGKPIPASTYTAVYKSAIGAVHVPAEKAHTPAAHVLVEGFPRAADQLKVFEWEVGTPVAAVVLDASEPAALKRARAQKPGLDGEQFATLREAALERTRLMVESLERGSVTVHKVDASGDDAGVCRAVSSALGWGSLEGVELDFSATAP